MKTNHRSVRIEWGHCDPAGIVYFPRYFEFFDAATVAMFEKVTGMPKGDMVARYDIVGFPMVDVRATFSAPSRYGEDVIIATTIAEWGRSSFRVHHKLLKGDVVAVEAWEARVWVGRRAEDPLKISARPIPPELIAMFNDATV